MSNEKKPNDTPQISDEQLQDVSAGGKTFSQTTDMKWDNVKNADGTDIAIEELTLSVERIETD